MSPEDKRREEVLCAIDEYTRKELEKMKSTFMVGDTVRHKGEMNDGKDFTYEVISVDGDNITIDAHGYHMEYPASVFLLNVEPLPEKKKIIAIVAPIDPNLPSAVFDCDDPEEMREYLNKRGLDFEPNYGSQLSQVWTIFNIDSKITAGKLSFAELLEKDDMKDG